MSRPNRVTRAVTRYVSTFSARNPAVAQAGRRPTVFGAFPRGRHRNVLGVFHANGHARRYFSTLPGEEGASDATSGCTRGGGGGDAGSGKPCQGAGDHSESGTERCER